MSLAVKVEDLSKRYRFRLTGGELFRFTKRLTKT